jgi:hypothetical protein
VRLARVPTGLEDVFIHLMREGEPVTETAAPGG